MLIKLNDSVTRARRGVNIAAITILAATPLTLAIPAQALSSADEIVTIAIQASDLDSSEGIANIYETFNREAVKACDYSVGRTLADRQLEKVCAEDLVDDFVYDLNNEAVTAMHYNGDVFVE